MNLHQLLDGLVDVHSFIDNNREVLGLALDSREVREGFVFIAVSGATQHGMSYLFEAKKKGAYAVIYDPQGCEEYMESNLFECQIAINELSSHLGLIANRFYQSPSKSLDVIGITGTNGKTTCSQFLNQVIPESGVIGTLGWGTKGALKKTINTTPDALAIQKMLAEFKALKIPAVAMEVSSHGLQQGRVNEVSFKGAVFTNLSRDHLDYHGSMEAYLSAKSILFQQQGLEFVVVNTDDAHAEHFLNAAPKTAKRWAFSSAGMKDSLAENVNAEEIKHSLKGIKFMLSWRNERILIKTKIVGDFNLENILAVITVLLAQGYSIKKVADKINNLVPVEGRMERYGGFGKPFVFVDYAHTPDALEKVLISLRKYCLAKLKLVFGCGGNRDKGKRQLMGTIAEQLADQIIITNDNPRFEDPETIINNIKAGCKKQNYQIIQNREQAIQQVINRADKSDCILIAGKGHESYQDVKGVKHPFSDQLIVKQALLEWGDISKSEV